MIDERRPAARRPWRWRRTADAASNALLALLVLISLGLAGVLWSGALWAASPAAGQVPGSLSYQVPGDVETGGNTTSVAAPERLVLLYPSAQGDVALGNPSSGAFVRAWNAVLALLPRVASGAARPVGFKDVTAALAAFSAPSPFRGGAACRAGVEVDIGAALPWSDWLQAATGAAAAPQQWAGAVDRVILLPGGGGTPPGAPELFLLEGGSAAAAIVAGSSYTVLEAALCALLPQAQAAGYPVAPLAPAGVQSGLPHGVVASVPDPAALLIPEASALPAWRPLQLGAEAPSANRLAQAVFPDLLAVRRTTSAGSTVFTSATSWMLTVGPSQSTLVVPAGSGATPSWDQSLVDALRFVDLRGGWPAGAWLSGVQPGSACTILACSAATSFTELFSQREAGLPVLTPADSAPAISVTVGAGGDPTFYLRAVRLPGAPVGRRPQVVSAAAAINAVYQTPPPGVGGPLEVVAVLPAWAPVGAVLQPVWAVEVDAAPWGRPATALVSAVSGGVVGWSGL